MEGLCQFSCCFDVKKDIGSFVRSLRYESPASEEPRPTGSSGEPSPRKESAGPLADLPGTRTDPQVRIIGQERFNEVLFVWDSVSSFSSEEVTHVGLYDPAKQKSSVLFVHERRINIISCSVNQERSMIAYVTLEGAREGAKPKSKGRLSPFRVYRAFLAEIFPQHRIFDLNVERRNLLRAQFLWSRQTKDRDAASKESKLLFLLHKESVGLYCLQLARMGNKVMMSAPPATSQVLKQFVWAQWDAINQLLYVVQMKSRPDEQALAPVLRCLEFSHKTSQFTKILELVLPFPIKTSSGKEQYSDIVPSRTISGKSFNMEVIFQANGSFCICYQHPTKPKVLTPSAHSSDPDLSWDRRRGGAPTEERESQEVAPDPGGGVWAWPGPPGEARRRRAISDITGLSLATPAHGRGQPARRGQALPPLEEPTPGLPAGAFGLPWPQGEPSSSPSSPAAASPASGQRSSDRQDLVDLNYSVLVLHHMTVLHCSVPQIPRELAETTRLFFTPLESYIAVYSPGHVLHLLNVSPEVVPCLHIAFHGRPPVPLCPLLGQNGDETTAVWDSSKGCQTLTHFSQEKTTSTSGDCLYNAMTGRAYRISINKDAVPSLLAEADCHSVKLALVHLVTVHLRDSVLIKKVMGELSKDVTSLDLPELLAEHLMGATFSALRRQFDRETLLLLQFTNTDTSRGQLVETKDGERLVSFRHGVYSPVPQINVHKRDWMERRLTMESVSNNLWENLEQRVRAHSLTSDPSGQPVRPPLRFHPRNIELEIRKQRAQSLMEGSLTRQSPTQRTSFLKKVAASARRVMTPSKKAGLQSGRETPWVLVDEDAALPDNSQDTILSLTLERLVMHLQRHSMMPVSKEKMYNIAQMYLSCQLQQVKQLVLLMLYCCGYPDPRTIPGSTITLIKKPPPRCFQLFHLIERFYMAVQSICFPVPLGFPTLFTVQGFRCLEPRMFLQYVDHGVLQLTEDFLTRLLQEVPDDSPEQVEMKIQVITRLPKGLSVQAMQKWNHPIAMHYLAQQYVADTLKEESSRVLDYRNRPFRSSSQSSTNLGDGNQSSVAATFPPLSTLLRLLENKDPKVGSVLKTQSSETGLHSSGLNLVDKMALRQTVEKYGPNLSTVSF